MTTDKFSEHQQFQRKHQASERVNNRFKGIKESLLDLSLSDDYERIKRYLATETGGCDLETLLDMTQTILVALDRVEQNAQQQLANWVYWTKREQERKND